MRPALVSHEAEQRPADERQEAALLRGGDSQNELSIVTNSIFVVKREGAENRAITLRKAGADQSRQRT